MDRPVIFRPRDYVLFALIAVGTWIFAQGDAFYRSLDIPYRSQNASPIITIRPGQNARGIGKQLDQAGLVLSPWHFRAAVWIENSASRLQAGEYESTRPLSAREWVRKLAKGQRYLHRITIPEGWDSMQIASYLENEGLVSAKEFLEAISHPAQSESHWNRIN